MHDNLIGYFVIAVHSDNYVVSYDERLTAQWIFESVIRLIQEAQKFKHAVMLHVGGGAAGQGSPRLQRRNLSTQHYFNGGIL